MEKLRDFSAPGHLDNMAFPTDTVLRLACAIALTEQRRRREVKDAFEEFSEEEFRQCFRLSKRTVRSLCDELDPIIGCQRASGLSTERKVLCALRFFATGSFQKSIGREEHIGMSQPAVSNTIHEVTEAIITVAARKMVADFLLTTAAKDEAKEEFVLRGCIPGVLACADGTLVTIRKPEGFRQTTRFVPRLLGVGTQPTACTPSCTSAAWRISAWRRRLSPQAKAPNSSPWQSTVQHFRRPIQQGARIHAQCCVKVYRRVEKRLDLGRVCRGHATS
ncbi:uncharacterized protein LOC142814755 isoform X2 [Rhipicephalus microplus]|uniref:uncharacterized protein LOC142814755 isoform X2 n=1 Tax=Rhipicephalus microplus TaxID=6941 RepID=UPI003F6B126E